MTKENIYYMDDNAFDRFYKRARYQANSFVAGKLGSKAADYLTTLPDFAYLICKLMLDPDVPSSRKLDLGFALLYVLSPLDLVPDSVPLLGKLDDASNGSNQRGHIQHIGHQVAGTDGPIHLSLIHI